MSLWTLEQKDIALVLNSLYNDKIVTKPLVTMPAKEELFEFNFLLIDLHQWLSSMINYTGKVYNLDMDYLQDYFDKYKNDIFFANLSGSTEAIDNRISKFKSNFFVDTEKLYIYFLKYIEECQFKLFDLYSVNRKTTAVPLMPFSFILNRYSNELYDIYEEPSLTDNGLNSKTEYGMNNSYYINSLKIDDGFKRTSRDLGIRLYHVDLNAKDTSPMTKRWDNAVKELNPNLETYRSRVDMIKKLYTQYMYVGFNELIYSDGTNENIFLLNFPIKTALNINIGEVKTSKRNIKFEVK